MALDCELAEDWIETNTRQSKKTCSCGFETPWTKTDTEAETLFLAHLRTNPKPDQTEIV